MSLDDWVEELVEERSLDALERLTGSRHEDVLESLIQAAARIMRDEQDEENDDRIVEEIRQHLVQSRAVGILQDALQDRDAIVQEFALSCLGEIGDTSALPAMIGLLERSPDRAVREAAAAHLALLTHYEFGQDAGKWRDWLRKQATPDAESVT